jgi:hypothetical protein
MLNGSIIKEEGRLMIEPFNTLGKKRKEFIMHTNNPRLN